MKRKRNRRDGVYERSGAYWISWTDASGQRRRERTQAATAAAARSVRQARLNRVERAEVLGFTPPSDETFEAVAEKFIAFQRSRLTPAAFSREEGILRQHLMPAFPARIADVRSADIQRYILNRTGKVSADSIIKEFNCLKHLLRLAVEWEFIPVNPARGGRTPCSVISSRANSKQFWNTARIGCGP